ncbi:MAG: SH3 domain-containing protein, partial [Anaerolinea sp.]|nr:SH3 domain-containing protein [Anaerolinea sp.]
GSSYMWDSTNTRFALGYGTNLYSGPTSWTIAVVDVTVGDITMMLTREDPAAFAIPADFFYVIPVVQQFNDFTIIFNTIPFATEGLPQYPTFGWDFTGSTTFPEDSYISLALDQNALGEAVMLVSSSAYPDATLVESGLAIPNIVSAYNAFTGMRQDYLFAPNAFRVNFTQSSELVTVSYVDGMSGEPNAILTYTRGGMLAGEMSDGSLPVFNVTSVDGIAGGFIATASAGEGRAGGTTLYRVYTRPGSDPAPFTAVPVWNSSLGANYEIAWVSDEQYGPIGQTEPWGFANPNTVFVPSDPVAIPLQPTLPVAIPIQPTLPVAIPVVPTLPVAVPVQPALPVAVPVQLRIGGQARVQTTAGDTLNVRTGAGRSFPVITQVNPGTIVSIIQGPVAADGFVWWQIMLPTGVVGWSVEAADGVQTLVPLN